MIYHDLVIVGGGSAGLSAAKSAYDNGIKDIIILERMSELGGILNQCIHSGFGLHYFKEELTGPEFAYRFISEIKKRGIEYKLDTQVLDINKNLEITYCNENEGIVIIKAKAIIYACGCNERTAGQIALPGERPNGVFTAGLAQKYLNIDGFLVGKKVYILGSGDIGLIMARRMTLEGAEVIGVSELMPYSNGLNRNIVQCLNDFNIPLKLYNTVIKIHGKTQLEGITICDVDDNLKPIKGKETFIKCDTLLLSVGLYPFNVLLENAGCEIYKNTKGCSINQNLETSIKGIFSCGNVLHVHDLVDYVVEEAEVAGKNAAKLILEGEKKILKDIKTTHNAMLGYLLPNHIEVYDDLNEVEFSFRVKKPLKKANIFIKNNDNVIKKILKLNLIPSEMMKLKLNDINFNSIENLSIEVEEII